VVQPSGRACVGVGLGLQRQAAALSRGDARTIGQPDLGAINTWLPTGLLNDTRRIELAWNAFRSHPTGRSYSTQFGKIVSAPTDLVCRTQRTIGSETYTLLCLEQQIAPSMTTLGFPGSSVQKDYDSRGVVLPN